MTTSQSPSTAAIRKAVRRPRRRRPGPFPVIITRPATTTGAPLTAIQRERRRRADQCGAELTAAALQGRRPDLEHPCEASVADLPKASRIIAIAAALAADSEPGAFRVGRDLRGRPVAVVLHAEDWSLLIRPARVGYAPTSWTFFDPSPRRHYRRVSAVLGLQIRRRPQRRRSRVEPHAPRGPGLRRLTTPDRVGKADSTPVRCAQMPRSG